MSLNEDQKAALAARHKEDEALQKKLAAKAQEDSDRYDEAVGKQAEEPSEPELPFPKGKPAAGKGNSEGGK